MLAETNPRISESVIRSRSIRGRDAELITKLVTDVDAEHYLCGPTRFLADIHAGLIARGVSAERLHTETFGPVG